MKINNISNINNLQSKESIKNKKIESVAKVKNLPTDIFEQSSVEDKGHVYDKSTIDKLRMESAKSYDALKKMIEELLTRQGKTLNLVSSDDVIKVDATTRAEANELIGPDGPLGIEAMSDTIVDFAKAISGGDKSKLDTLVNAIDKGFSEAGRILGGLPEISLKTYDRIMEKLDIWKNE